MRRSPRAPRSKPDKNLGTEWVFIYPKTNTTRGINMIVPEHQSYTRITYKFRNGVQVALFLLKHFYVFWN